MQEWVDRGLGKWETFLSRFLNALFATCNTQPQMGLDTGLDTRHAPGHNTGAISTSRATTCSAVHKHRYMLTICRYRQFVPFEMIAVVSKSLTSQSRMEHPHVVACAHCIFMSALSKKLVCTAAPACCLCFEGQRSYYTRTKDCDLEIAHQPNHA